MLCALPASRVTPAQARHALLLLELEQLLGVESEGGGNGRIKAHRSGGRAMADMSMHERVFREELRYV